MAAPPDWVTLRIFVTALETGSITRAADRCGIATSAAAKRLQLLEANSRVPLLERGARGVRPTAAGEVLARHARAMLDFAARLRDDLQALAAGGLGSVRLHATTSALAGHDLADLLATFAVEKPGIRVELQESTSLPILHDLLEGRADLGIITSAGQVPAGLEARLWREDRLQVVVPAGHPFAARAAVGFAEVLDQPLIGPSESSALALLVEEAAQRLGHRPRWRFRVPSTDAIRRLVAAGHGITVMPDGVARPYERALGLRGLRLTERWARRRLHLVAQPAAQLPPSARLLHDHLLRPLPTAQDRTSTRRG